MLYKEQQIQTAAQPSLLDYAFVAGSLLLVGSTIFGALVSNGYTCDFFSHLSFLERLASSGNLPSSVTVTSNTLRATSNSLLEQFQLLHSTALDGLTNLALIGDFVIFKSRASGFHTVSLILHVINAFLVFCASNCLF